MEFKRIKPRKKPNHIRAIILLVLLLLVVAIWLNADWLMEWVFGTE